MDRKVMIIIVESLLILCLAFGLVMQATVHKVKETEPIVLINGKPAPLGQVLQATVNTLMQNQGAVATQLYTALTGKPVPQPAPTTPVP